MQEKMRKMKDQIEEQKRTIRQEVVADVIAQLQNAEIIDPKILAALSIPSPMGSTSTLAATERNSQNCKGLYLIACVHQMGQPPLTMLQQRWLCYTFRPLSDSLCTSLF